MSEPALDASASEALDALARGWDLHATQWPVEYSSEQALEEYGANTFPITLGGCARDHEPLTS